MIMTGHRCCCFSHLWNLLDWSRNIITLGLKCCTLHKTITMISRHCYNDNYFEEDSNVSTSCIHTVKTVSVINWPNDSYDEFMSSIVVNPFHFSGVLDFSYHHFVFMCSNCFNSVFCPHYYHITIFSIFLTVSCFSLQSFGQCMSGSNAFNGEICGVTQGGAGFAREIR
jgi:hypothetical protein